MPAGGEGNLLSRENRDLPSRENRDLLSRENRDLLSRENGDLPLRENRDLLLRENRDLPLRESGDLPSRENGGLYYFSRSITLFMSGLLALGGVVPARVAALWTVSRGTGCGMRVRVIGDSAEGIGSCVLSRAAPT